MSSVRNIHKSFGDKVSLATNRMAHRMGGEFVVNDRWDSVVRISLDHQNKTQNRKNRT